MRELRPHRLIGFDGEAKLGCELPGLSDDREERRPTSLANRSPTPY